MKNISFVTLVISCLTMTNAVMAEECLGRLEFKDPPENLIVKYGKPESQHSIWEKVNFTEDGITQFSLLPGHRNNNDREFENSPAQYKVFHGFIPVSTGVSDNRLRERTYDRPITV
ncbi:MAG: hypothetical protein ACWA5L_01305 [bacterium]